MMRGRLIAAILAVFALLPAWALGQVVGGPISAAPVAKCNDAPIEARANGYCIPALKLTRFDAKDVDYGLTGSAKFQLLCYQAFGASCSGKASPFTGSITTTTLTVTAASAGPGVIFPYAGVSAMPLNGAGILANTHITSQLTGVSVAATAAWTAAAGQTIPVASCTGIHQYMPIVDVTAGSVLVGYVGSCSANVIHMPSDQVSSTVAPAIASSGAADSLTILGGVGTYAIDLSQSVGSESMSTPTFWENADGTLDLTQDADTFDATVSTATAPGGGSTWRGHAYVVPAYFEVQMKMQATCPYGGGGWVIGQWVTPIWADVQNAKFLHFPYQVANYGHYWEGDSPESFQCLFGNAAWLLQWSPHHWYNYPISTSSNLVTTFDTLTSTSTIASTYHRYGLLVTKNSWCNYFDDALVACHTWGNFVTETQNATQSFTTASTSITLASPVLGDVSAGMLVYDNAAAAAVGTVLSYGLAGGVTPSQVGTPQNVAGVTTKSITLGAGVTLAAGGTVIILADNMCCQTGNNVYSDSKSNTYTLDAACNHGGFENWMQIAHSTLTTQLATGDTITVAAPGPPFGNWAVLYSPAITARDGTATCTNAASGGSSFPAGSQTPTQANDLVIGVSGRKTNTGLTADPLYTPLPAGDWGNYGSIVSGYLIDPGTSAHNYTSTASAITDSVSTAMVMFKTTGAAGTLTLQLVAASSINSSGAGDQLVFSENPPPTGSTPWSNSVATLFNQSLVNPKYGGGPNAPVQIKSLQIWQPFSSWSRNQAQPFIAANDNDLSLEHEFKRAMGE